MDKEIKWAEKVLNTIENTKCPMLMFDEEKDVVKEALELFIDTAEKRELACEGD